MVKLSIIVPVYNVAPYLRKCVDSLLAQHYNDYEILLVDDGSTDNSPQICDEYVRAFEIGDCKLEIKCIHQENGGLSAARNAGLKVANGEYVCFVDSDDYWEENVLGRLMEQVEREKLDVLRFDYQNVNEQYDVYIPDKYPHQVDTCRDVVVGENYLNERIGYGCYAWQFIVRSEIVPFFKEGIFFEDTEWMPRMLLSAKCVNSTHTVVYNYLTRSGSITKKYDKEHIRKKNESLMQVNLSLQNFLQKVSDGRWLNGCIADNVYSIMDNAASYDYASVSNWVRVLKENNMLPIRGYKVRQIMKLRYELINLSPRIYCWLRHVRMTYL